MRLLLTYSLIDLKLFLRSNRYMMPVLGFPIIFYILFGLQNARNTELSVQIVGNFILFAQLGAVFFILGAALSQERNSPWKKYLLLLPSRKYYLITRLFTTMVLMVVASLFLYVSAIVFSALKMSNAQLMQLIVFSILSSIPFIFLCLALAFLVPIQYGWPLISMLYVFLAYIGGLWFPVEQLPVWLQPISHISPTYLASCFTLQFVDGAICTNIQKLYLLSYGCIFAFLAWIVAGKKLYSIENN